MYVMLFLTVTWVIVGVIKYMSVKVEFWGNNLILPQLWIVFERTPQRSVEIIVIINSLLL